jgi:hypothetical protein
VFNLSGNFEAVGSTFVANAADFDGASIYNLVYDGQTARTAQATLLDTIVAGGLGPVDLASSKASFITPANLGTATADVSGSNLITTMAAREQGTITGTPLTDDPMLGPLQNNGGPTETMAPLADSPVIDAGSAFGLTTDQRGLARPSDFPDLADAGDGADIGAVELQGPKPQGPAPLAFGRRTRVTLWLAAKRFRARGPIAVVVVNANGFAVSGRLSAETAKPLASKRAKRRVALKARRLRVSARSRAVVALKLPSRLRSVLAHRGRLALRLRAVVHDPAGNSRTVVKTVTPRLKRR